MSVRAFDRAIACRALAVAAACLLAGADALAQTAAKQTIRVPILMEEATVRGKVAVLETRRENRKVIEGLAVSVWSTKPSSGEDGPSKRSRREDEGWERDRLLHETKTDDLGLFELPLLAVGNYLLEVSEVQFRLAVVPQSAERAGQTEPKVLLILIPKEVVAI